MDALVVIVIITLILALGFIAFLIVQLVKQDKKSKYLHEEIKELSSKSNWMSMDGKTR